MSRETKVQFIFAVFVAMVPIAVLSSAKLTTVFGLTFTVGAFAYAITFPCTDVIGECLGKAKARQLVHLGLLGYALTVAFALLAVGVPPADFWAENQSAYELVLGLTPRIAGASVIAYYASQLTDVALFHWWRQRTDGRALWLRNTASTAVSQLLDSAIFVTVAFAGVVPSNELPALIVGQYVLKLGIALIDTPVVYAAVRWLGREDDAVRTSSHQVA